jgi:hypothetical protein
LTPQRLSRRVGHTFGPDERDRLPRAAEGIEGRAIEVNGIGAPG